MIAPRSHESASFAPKGSFVYFDEIVQRLEARGSPKIPKKVARRFLLTTFLETRDVKVTAARCGITTSAVYSIVGKACYTARRLAGIWPPEPGLEDDGERSDD